MMRSGMQSSFIILKKTGSNLSKTNSHVKKKREIKGTFLKKRESFVFSYIRFASIFANFFR
jgi:hypothetical protein